MNGGILKMSDASYTSYLEIDLGASGNRCTTESGKIFTFANNMVMLNTMETTNLRVENEVLEDNLECKISKVEGDNGASFFPTNVLVGSMASRHRMASERPSGNLSKYKQKINYISAIVACAMDRIENGVSENIFLTIATPPIEVFDAEATFNKYLVGKYEIEFPKYKDGTKTTVNIVGVKCYEESFMALTSFMFNMNGTLRETARKYAGDKIFSLDIGASTTDGAMTDHGKYIDKASKTWKIGGNMVRDAVIEMVSQKYNIELSVADAERAVSEGRIRQGVNYIVIGDLLDTAKYELAAALVNKMDTYFKRIDEDINSIRAIVVSGGGSLQSQYINENKEVVKTSEPMSYYVTQELKKYANGIEVVHYGEEPRFANVKGLYIKAMFEKARKEKQNAATTETKEVATSTANVIPEATEAKEETNTAII